MTSKKFVPVTAILAEYAFKKYKELPGGGETEIFSAELHRNGKKVAQVNNDGQGGCDRMHFVSREEEAAYMAKAKELPACYWLLENVEPTLEDLNILLVEAAKNDKRSRKWTTFRQSDTERLEVKEPFDAAKLPAMIKALPELRGLPVWHPGHGWMDPAGVQA